MCHIQYILNSQQLDHFNYWSKAKYQMSRTIIADVVYKKKILLAGGGATQLLSCKIYITDLVYAKIRFGHALYHSKFLRKTASALGHGDKTILWGLAHQIHRRKRVHRVLSKWSLISIVTVHWNLLKNCKFWTKMITFAQNLHEFWNTYMHTLIENQVFGRRKY